MLGVFANTPQLNADINRAGESLQGDVVRIGYDLGMDWIGDPSIFFKVVLSDHASHPSRLRLVAQRIALKLMDELQTDQKGVHAYFNFRSQSEVAQMNDPAWA